MAKTRRARKARKSSRKSVRKNKVYRGGNPLDEKYKEYVRLYKAWSEEEEEEKKETKLNAVMSALNTLIDNIKSSMGEANTNVRLIELQRTKNYLDGVKGKGSLAFKEFQNSKNATKQLTAMALANKLKEKKAEQNNFRKFLQEIRLSAVKKEGQTKSSS